MLQSPGTIDPEHFRLGATVEITNLSSNTSLNGKIGTILAYISSSNRYGVKLNKSKNIVSIKATNLLLKHKNSDTKENKQKKKKNKGKKKSVSKKGIAKKRKIKINPKVGLNLYPFDYKKHGKWDCSNPCTLLLCDGWMRSEMKRNKNYNVSSIDFSKLISYDVISIINQYLLCEPVCISNVRWILPKVNIKGQVGCRKNVLIHPCCSLSNALKKFEKIFNLQNNKTFRFYGTYGYAFTKDGCIKTNFDQLRFNDVVKWTGTNNIYLEIDDTPHESDLEGNSATISTSDTQQSKVDTV